MKAMKIILLAAWFVSLPLMGSNTGITSTLNARVLGLKASAEDTSRINTIIRRGFFYFKTKDVKIGRIKESVDSEVVLSLYDLNNNILYSDTGKRAGLEVIDKIFEYL